MVYPDPNACVNAAHNNVFKKISIILQSEYDAHEDVCARYQTLFQRQTVDEQSSSRLSEFAPVGAVWLLS